MDEKHPLRAYRDRTGQSLEELAKECGTTRATLSRIENGLQNPSLDLMDRIRTATGGAVRADDFLPFRSDDASASSPIATGSEENKKEAASMIEVVR